MNQVILTQVFTLFLLMAVGAVARRTGCLTEAVVKGLTGLLLRFCLPMMIFAAFLRPFSPELLASAGRMLAYSLTIQVFLIGLGILLFFLSLGINYVAQIVVRRYRISIG